PGAGAGRDVVEGDAADGDVGLAVDVREGADHALHAGIAGSGTGVERLAAGRVHLGDDVEGEIERGRGSWRRRGPGQDGDVIRVGRATAVAAARAVGAFIRVVVCL